MMQLKPSLHIDRLLIKQNDKIGDMIVTVEIQIPQDLSVEEINLYKKLQELRGEKRVF